MFLHVSVILSTGECLLQGGACSRGCLLRRGLVSGRVPGGDPQPPDGYCCGRYASYWNAFLFLFNIFLKEISHSKWFINRVFSNSEYSLSELFRNRIIQIHASLFELDTTTKKCSLIKCFANDFLCFAIVF